MPAPTNRPAPKKGPTTPRPTPPVSVPAASPADFALPNFPNPSGLAEDLARYLANQNLVVGLSDAPDAPRYVGLEGWQFVGAQLGQAGEVKWCREVTTADTPTYHARAVLLHVATGRRLGAGEAVATMAEPELSTAPAHVLHSLAQNRALINAFYHSLGWLMRLANVHAAPVEVAVFLPDFAGAAPAPPAKAPTPPEPAPPAAAPAPTLRQRQQQLAADAQAAADAKPQGTAMTAAQRTQILDLLKNPHVLPKEINQVNMKLNIYTEETAAELIRELKQRISRRT